MPYYAPRRKAARRAPVRRRAAPARASRARAGGQVLRIVVEQPREQPAIVPGQPLMAANTSRRARY